MKKAVLLAALVVFVVSAWWFAAAPQRESPAPIPAGVAGAGGEPAARTTAERETPARSDAERTLIPPEAGGRGDSAPETSRPPSPRHGQAMAIRVRVVDKATQEPCAGAEVLYSTGAQLQVPAGAEIEALLRADGGSARADAEGFAVVHLLAGWQRLVACAAGRFGELSVERGQEPPGGFRIEVERDVHVRVRALDAKGGPCPAIPISVLWGVAGSVSAGIHSVATGTTNEAGELVVRHVQARFPNFKWGPGRRTVRFAAGFQCGEGRPPVVDLDDPPEDAVIVVVPESGRVEVEACEADGGLVRDRGWMSLRLSDGEKCITSPRAQVDGGGLAVFTHVPLGRTWTLDARFDLRHATLRIDGPRGSGEKVVARITLPPIGLALAGRALAPDGRPLAKRYLWCTAQFGDAGWVRWAETDAEGRFRFMLDKKRHAGRPCDALIVELTTGPPDNVRTGTMARGPFLPQLAPGENPVGDLMLAPAPIAASVRFTGGAPEGDTSLRLEISRRKPGASGTEAAWVRANDVTALREDGRRFVLRASASGRVRIRVASTVHQRVPDVEVELPESREIEIPLARAGSMVARILVDGLPQNGMTQGVQPLRAVRVDAAGSGEDDGQDEGSLLASQTGSGPGHLEYSWEKLTPGVYRVELRLGTAHPLLTFHDVVVRSGEQTRDPRLLPIDLRKAVRRISVSLRDAEGKPVEHARGFFDLDGPDGAPAQAYGWFEGDQLRILTTQDHVDLRLAVQGWRRASLERIVRDTELTLTPGPRIRVVLKGGPPVLPQGARLVAQLGDPKPPEPLRNEPRDQPEGRSRPTSSLDGTGSVTWSLSYGGEVRVKLFLNSGNDWHEVALATFTVPDDAKEHGFEVAIEPEKLRAALAGAGR